MTTSLPGRPAPTVHVEAASGVDPAFLDYALERTRALCARYPIDSLNVRMSRTRHPAMPAAVRTDATAVWHGRTVRTRAVGRCARSAVEAAVEGLDNGLRTAQR
ncbi:hypothetical protein DI005_09855 [Prauserella sp. PE36]|uniref:hypothetical protein n=1 Tax=Prauserella sp. PE36 TaxID=1504709 RepID=UPI000D890C6F|nr:hypothetical protein [Prauserella sp. PE36]PXY29216.1 hypothetical protein BAY59_16520 [Prauserella coralliicola]RBM21565.1 hypothetical protein DI005_09855 [Prauserella sp. PE36]